MYVHMFIQIHITVHAQKPDKDIGSSALWYSALVNREIFCLTDLKLCCWPGTPHYPPVYASHRHRVSYIYVTTPDTFIWVTGQPNTDTHASATCTLTCWLISPGLNMINLSYKTSIYVLLHFHITTNFTKTHLSHYLSHCEYVIVTFHYILKLKKS